MSAPTNNNSYIQVTPQSPSGGAGSGSKVKVVAGYGFQQKLGSGSFAVVFKGVRLNAASPPSLEDTAAIKAISRNSDKLTPKVLHNLEKEISILRTYQHRNIVCLKEVQKTARHYYLILEYCAGGDLQHLIRDRKNGRLTEGLCRRLMRDLAGGLQFLNRHQLIHRDIKPQNLLLTGPLPLDEINDPARTNELEMERQKANFPSEQFVLKIADFGFARHLQTTSLAETLCGSPLYMAPEILSHQRYDEKADLWSVGTVLFEMVAGKPPFNGDNHIHLLNNIQKNAVRLPAGVRVSKECVNLLRILLNRNPLSRASFREFLTACDAFVALGCNGRAMADEGTSDTPVADSMMTVASNAPQTQTSTTSPKPQSIVTPTFGPANMNQQYPSQNHTLSPLVPSPPVTGAPLGNVYTIPENPPSESRTASAIPQQIDMPSRPQETPTSLQNSTDENSFVMVEHGSIHKSPSGGLATDNYFQPPQDTRYHLQQSPPSSPALFYQNKPVMSVPGDYTLPRQQPNRGMLSTSPGTGGALMGMLTGRGRLTSDPNKTGKQLESQIRESTKMLAASEDVGRRAVSVAHLGDHRAVHAIKLVMMTDSFSSSLLSTMPMEGIEEENQCDGEVTDDSGCTEIVTMARRRSSSTTDKSMLDARAEEEIDEMPFALHAESPPLLSAGIPSRSGHSVNKGTPITNARQIVKPTPVMIRAHFSEALSCYVKALHMLKGAFGAVEGVENEIENLLKQRLSNDQLNHLHQLKKRCEISKNWLGAQFNGVLERGDAANVEIRKYPVANDTTDRAPVTSVEELIYHQSLALGRDGAVKQLLGQNEQARACYRSAGLLAETLLMESKIVGDDRKKLEGYVDAFSTQISDLDQLMMQQSQHSRLSGAAVSVGSGRRGSGVIGLVGQPLVMDPSGR